MKTESIFRSKQEKIFYIGVAILLLFIFFAVLYKPIATMFFESDLLWLAPSHFEIFTNNPFFKTIGIYFFDLYQTNYFDPIPSIYYFLIMSFFGSQTMYLILASILFYTAISVIFFLILNAMKIDFRISFFAALTFFASFIHFHIYMWPVAAHHIFVIFFLLLVFYLYLEANERMDSNRPYRLYHRLALFFSFLSSFCAVTILLLPASILVHILYCTKDDKAKIKKYDMWLPLFLVYLGYPLMRAVYIGQYFISNYLHFDRADFFNSQSLILYPVLFFVGIISLFLFRIVIKIQKYKIVRRIEGVIITTVIFLIFAYLLKRQLTRDVSISTLKRSFVSPYNLIAPLVASLDFFLMPLKNIFAIDSARAYHFVPFNLSFSSVLLSVGLLAVFFKTIFVKHKGLIFFIVIYLIAIRLMWARIECPSRHMAYTSFLFSIIFSSSAVCFYDLLTGKIKVSKFVKDGALILVFMPFFIMNIFAVRLEVFRGRLANTFYTYDYIRIAKAIRDDIDKTQVKIEPGNIYINDVPLTLMPSRGFFDGICCADPLKHYNLRFALVQVFGDPAVIKVNINQVSKKRGENARVYYMDYEKIKDANGINIEPFFYVFDKAIMQMKSSNYAEALKLFKKAAEVRPFCLNYILGRYGLEDSKLITNNATIRSWVDRLAHNQKTGISEFDKTRPIAEIINKELDAYIQCLFFLSYLEHRNGHAAESRYWFSHMKYIESSYGEMASRLSHVSIFESDNDMKAFLSRFGNVYFDAAQKMYINSMKGYKFVFTVLSNRDIMP